MALSIPHVSFEHHRAALGIGETSPRISWRFQGNVSNWTQSSYELEIQRDNQTNTFPVDSSDSVLVPWPDDPLQSGEEAVVRVRSFGHLNQPNSSWSEPVTVEPGLLGEEDWQDAVAIASERPTEANGTHRPIYFRKEFAVDEEVLSARLYITALGVYEAELNGEPVGDYVLAPGWQSYHNRHEYNTYDVTELLQDGQNAIGVTVGEGWYSGALSWNMYRNNYGDTLGFLSLLSITTSDGEMMYVPSDDTWQSSTGPIVASEIYNGEKYDSTQEMAGWTSPDFDASAWLGTREIDFDKTVLASPDAPPVRRVEEQRLQRVFSSASGKTVLDFGQNLVGWLRIHVQGPRGTNVSFVHTEGIFLVVLIKANENSDGRRRGSDSSAPQRQRHRQHHSLRRRPSMGAIIHLPRLPVCAGDRLARRDGIECGLCHCHCDQLGHGADGFLQLLESAAQQIPREHPVVHAWELPVHPNGLSPAGRATRMDW